MKKSVLVLVLLFSSMAFAKNPSVQQMVDEYFNSLNKMTPLTDECRTPGISCMDTVCNKLGQYGCDDKSEIDEVLKMCRGNFDGVCIQAACKHLGQYGCDDKNEVQDIARACVGNYGGDCLESICTRLGQYGCDDKSEVLDVLQKCAGN